MRVASIALLLLSTLARAEPRVTLRMAGVAPEGSSWARELKALARDIEAQTHGGVTIKWYLGGIAGDEVEVIERIRKGQLDGAGGSTFCPRLAPSMRVMLFPGLFSTWKQVDSVVSRLYPTLAHEFESNGFVGVAVSNLGSVVLFSRTAISDMSSLGNTRLWLWELDEVYMQLLPMIGMRVVPGSLADAGRKYDEGALDGFVSAPAGALGFQWSAQAHYFSDLHLGFVPLCTVIARRAFDTLSIDAQNAIRAAGAKLSRRMNDVMEAQENQLLDGLFEKQGLKRVRASQAFRAEFFARAREASATLSDKLLPKGLLAQVQRWLQSDEAAPAH